MTGIKNMNQYRVIIKLSNEQEVDAKVAADSKERAVERLISTPQFRQFVGNAKIQSTSITLLGEYKEVDNTARFIFGESKEKPNWFVVTDTSTMFVVRFEQGRYNETATITPLNDGAGSDIQPETSLREIGEYLVKYHPEVL